MSDNHIIKTLFLILGSSTLPIVVLALYLFNRPEKFEKWMLIFYQFLYGLSRSVPNIKRKLDKKLVAVSIQNTVNYICNNLNNQSPGILPHALKIEWIKEDTPESFISKGRTVVRLKHYENQDRNIVESTLLYVRHGLLPRAKNYLDTTLRQSAEYLVASNVFVARQDTGAYDYFVQRELTPAIKQNSHLKEDLQLLEYLNSVGYFTRVFLTEVTLIGQKLLGTVPTESVKRELREFARFLDTIARKAKDENVPLSFMGTKIKVSLILVAKQAKIARFGIKPYTARIQRCLREGYDSIYLAAWGKEYIGAVISLKARIESDMLTILRRYDYPVHGSAKAILMVCQPKSSYLAEQMRINEEIHQAFSEIVPEIKNGQVTIVSVARIEHVGCKVAVKATDSTLRDPKGCCIGVAGKRLNQLKQRIPNEFIGVSTWSENIMDFIKNAISPLNPRNIEKIEIDQENLVADITVFNNESRNKALGRLGHNIRLASILTGYHINVQLNPDQSTNVSPEQELREILERIVLEIRNKEIEIVKIARAAGIASKVIVKWASQAGSIQKQQRASEACYGQHRENLQKIRQYFLTELIYFHEWCNIPEQQIAVCLYPIKNNRIYSVEIDNLSNLAVVTLKDIADKEILTDTDLALCEDVTGFQIELIHS